MAKEPEVREGKAEDYEYDLAHETTADRPTGRAVPAPSLPPDMHATGDSGDYGHDLAHDMG